MTPPDHPIQIRLRDASLERSRLTVFFRLILAIPQYIWWVIWGIGMVLLLPIAWFGALFIGQLPQWAHDVFERYLRFSVHLYAYFYLAAEKWPGFIGDPDSYEVEVDVPPPAPQSRVKILFRLFLSLPPFFLLIFLGGGGGGGGGGSTNTGGEDGFNASFAASIGGGGVLVTIAFLAWWVGVFRAQTTLGFRDAQVYIIGYSAQVYGYFALLTDRYPNSSPKLSRPAAMASHPVTVDLDDDLRRSRLTVAFRVLLAIPHFLWLTLWGIVVFFAVIVSWFVTLFAGRTPEGLHRFIAAYARYQAHVAAFLYLAANPFPGFTGEEGRYPFDVHIAGPEPQHRAKTFFRLFLAIPAFMVSAALGGVLFAASVGSWFAALFTGRNPEGLRDLAAWATRYSTQLYAYLFLLTDRYPNSAPTLEVAPAGADPVPPAAPAPATPAPPASPTTTPGDAHQGWELPGDTSGRDPFGRSPEAG